MQTTPSQWASRLNVPRRLLLCVILTSVGCIDLDAPLGDHNMPSPTEREVMDASVSFGADVTFPFLADDVVASLTTVNGREELVVSGISADRRSSLALVLDSQLLSPSDPADLSQHGAVYMEIGYDGTDYIFDSTPQGELVWQGELEPGGDISARFEMFIPAFDRESDGPAELGVTLDGTFLVHLLDDEL